MRRNPQINKINIVTLGCSKNLVDSEKLMGQLIANGIEVVHDSDDTDAGTVVINTCGFIHDAKEESVETILNFIKAKEAGLIDNVYVMGCLSERYKKDLEKEILEVDRYFGVNDLEEIVQALGVDYRKELIGERQLTTPKHYAYLKISEGCDRTCSFCSIPMIRGKHKSLPIEELLNEAGILASKGVKELILIAQDLSYYGLDLYQEQKLSFLVNALSKIEGIEWIRLHYTYPANFPVEILPLMATNKKVCKYIDIPIQHINDGVLSKMRRASDAKNTIDLLRRFRKEVPGVAIRTTMLVGHPGEGEKGFEELKEFIKEFRFDRLGVFTYSHEEGTYGYQHFKDEVPESIKQQRADELMEIQQKISGELNKAKQGKEFRALIDRSEGDFYIGRTEFDSPEVDNEVLVPKDQGKLIPGNFYTVKITDATEYDLFGEVLGKV
ncbi:MAG: 30S ribosomal protein S12 methylthiotransferase RimO [Bacteroidetes bacterium]|nr:MAG: 30S ribosomal protein S12 methylthiotransferase RimO [Bacteroidota bacterium]